MSELQQLDVLCIGESLGLLVPESPGKLAHVRALRLGFGGAESNVAIGVARLGGAAGWAGRVGADGIGELILREIRAEGVEVHAAIDENAATAMMLKERPRAGASRVSYYRSVQAGSRLAAADLAEGLVERARILHVTGISAGLGEGPLGAVHAAIDRAHAAGVLVSFDVNHRSALWRDGRDPGAAYRELAARADIVFAGDDEAALFTGVTDPEAQLDAIRAMGSTCAVIKLGDRGAIASERDERVRRDALRVDVVDTVGAGDAFVAGWLAETARGSSIEHRIDTAIACGALACTGDGDWEAAPTRSDLLAFHSPSVDPVQR
ncbi:sugar kinase [Agreia bicolorata]|uniref:2-keto-3-deoxygluconate kinase n=1 Tax=Agreia bicolorata TaxID=110935 RepID=A0ABR5CBE6_9MICO|nr:sugar kinase [Agreia bicolorata]KJC62953.1 2-keto-3-deoxygluconate kinase [Agreia bicolorata]